MSVWQDFRADPHVPAHLTPLAATESGPDAKADDETPGIDASFFLQLGAQINTLADDNAAERERRRKMEPPGNEQLFAAGVVPATGVLTLDLGSVPIGRVWQVRRIVVGGTTVTATAAGSAYVFARGSPPTDLALTDCVDIFLGTNTPLPQGDTYGTHQLFLLPSEHLWVVFSGATPNQQYGASARVEDWSDASFQSTFAE